MRPMGHLLAPLALLVLATGISSAQAYSLLTGRGLTASATVDPAMPGGPSLGGASGPLIRARAELPDTAEAEAARGAAQSLFIGRASGGLFAPLAPRSESIPIDPALFLDDDPQAAMIRNLVAQAEAGPDGYDAVQHGARRRPDRPPTLMTLGEIFAWIEATPGQPHAIGRYQFIPSTLARLVDIQGAAPQERFSPQMQDRLADILLHEAGLAAHRSGELTRIDFMNNLARIWAGLPNSSGRSHYHGHAGNNATLTWTQFDREMARIFSS